eukprot:scaffold559808_cov23-Prasinocladus_malaysianus.AAC.1
MAPALRRQELASTSLLLVVSSLVCRPAGRPACPACPGTTAEQLSARAFRTVQIATRYFIRQVRVRAS